MSEDIAVKPAADKVSVGLGSLPDGRCAVLFRVDDIMGGVSVTLNVAAARAYGDLLLEAARAADRINKEALADKSV